MACEHRWLRLPMGTAGLHYACSLCHLSDSIWDWSPMIGMNYQEAQALADSMITAAHGGVVTGDLGDLIASELGGK